MCPTGILGGLPPLPVHAESYYYYNIAAVDCKYLGGACGVEQRDGNLYKPAKISI